MSEIDHELCRYLLRDEAIRAAEDAAAVPSIQHRDLPEAVADLRERVARLEAAQATLGSGDEIARLTAERDAARAECERLRAAGDAMAEALTWDQSCAYDAATTRGAIRQRIAAWSEARACVAELEGAAAAAANAGGEQQPEAWGVRWHGQPKIDFDFVYEHEESAADIATDDGNNGTVVPLYAAPQPPRGWLTEEERELIAGLTDDDEFTEEGRNIAKALLARSTPPSVKVPHLDDLEAAAPPRGWLTAKERETVEEAMVDYASNVGDHDCERIERVLRAILARETPPRVKRPNPNVVITTVDARERIDRQWIAAIRAAGGEVEG